MSHEIRTPVTAIMGLSRLAHESGSDEQLKDYLDSISNASSSLLTILDDVLDFSAIEAGKFKLIETPFDPLELLGDISSLFAASMSTKGLQFRVIAKPGLPHKVIGDAQRIRQILINLVGNALKFTRKGQVSLVLAASPAGHLSFTVSDTGIGIAPTKLASLYDPFTQADASIGRRFGGSGLGLAICSQLSSQMGGTLEAESKENSGSVFTLRLPLPEEEPHVPLATFDKPRTILLLTEDSDLAETLSLWLRETGLQVSVANSLSEDISNDQASSDVWIVDQALVSSGLSSCFPGPEWAPGPGLIIYLCELEESPPQTLPGITVHRLDKPALPQRLVRLLANCFTENTRPLASASLPAADHGDFADIRVLLAEDVELNRVIARGWMEKLGITPVEAANGAEAVNKAGQQAFDIIFMDVQMPEMGGIAATQLIREIPGREHTPVVAVSAGVFSQEIQSCLDSGMDDFISKPLDMAKIKLALQKWTGASKSRAAGPDTGTKEKSNTPEHATAEQDRFQPYRILELVDNDTDQAARVVQAMIDSINKNSARLSQHLADGDINGAADVMHALRGTISNFWQGELYRQTLMLEQTFRSGTLPSAPDITAWYSLADTSRSAMQDWLHECNLTPDQH